MELPLLPPNRVSNLVVDLPLCLPYSEIRCAHSMCTNKFRVIEHRANHHHHCWRHCNHELSTRAKYELNRRPRVWRTLLYSWIEDWSRGGGGGGDSDIRSPVDRLGKWLHLRNDAKSATVREGGRKLAQNVGISKDTRDVEWYLICELSTVERYAC